MSQQNKRTNTSTSVDPPVKRRRGRPRKDENLVKKYVPQNSHLPVTPLSVGLKRNQHVEVDRSNDIDNDMVGQAVSGVIEGSFDAGYLISVKAGNSETLLRGVVFQQGLFVPITMANDVAPQAKVCERREIPFPSFNPQSQGNGSITQSKQNNELPVRLDNQATMVPNQSASVTVSQVDDLPKNNPCASLVLQIMTQQDSDLGLENQSAPHNDEVVKVCEASTIVEGPKIDVQATKDVTSESASEPILPTESDDQAAQVQPQVVDSEVGQSGLFQIEIKSSNLEVPQNLPLDIIMEMPISPRNNKILQELQPEIASEVLRKGETSPTHKPVSDTADITLEGSTLKTDKCDPSKPVSSENDITQDTEMELVAEDNETSYDKNPVSDVVADISEGGFSQSTPKTGESTPSKAELEPEESVLPVMPETQISNSAGHTDGVDSILEDAIPSTQSQSNPTNLT